MGDVGHARFAVNCAGGAALGTKRRPIEKIERDGDQAFDGRCFLYLSNNQPKDGVCDGGEYWGGCGTAVECMGEAFYHRLRRWQKRQKNKKYNYVMALNGYQTGDKGCDNQHKTSAFNEWGIEHDV